MKCPCCREDMRLQTYGFLRLVDVYVCENEGCFFNGIERQVKVGRKDD
jgi:hypothetical protein